MHPDWLDTRLQCIVALIVIFLSKGLNVASNEEAKLEQPPTQASLVDADSKQSIDRAKHPILAGRGPKDYSYSAKGSRVRDLASFFESMRKNDFEVSNDDRSKDVIISLSQAASKLHFLSFGFTLSRRCSKYVDLITRPNIRTFTTINLLMKENQLFNEMEQSDANLLSKLENERSFDALAKLQMLLQTLESEKTNLKSDFEPAVQKDLLDCMNYYIYRHQRAISGVTNYVRNLRDEVLPAVAEPVKAELTLRKLMEQVESIKQVEKEEKSDGKLRNNIWLGNLSKLYHQIIDENFELPQVVQEFVTDPERLKRLDSLDPSIKISFKPKDGPASIDFSPLETKPAIQRDSELEAILEFEDQSGDLEKEVEATTTTSTTTSTEGPKLVVEALDSATCPPCTCNVLKSEPTTTELPIEAIEEQQQEPTTTTLRSTAAPTTTEPTPVQTAVNYEPTFTQIQQQASINPEPIPMQIEPTRAINVKVPVKLEKSHSFKTSMAQLEFPVEDFEARKHEDLRVAFLDGAFKAEPTLEGSCENAVLQFSEYLRIINWRYMMVEEAELLARGLNKFRHECSNWSSMASCSELNNKPSQWPMMSMTKKLSSWSLNQLKYLNQQQENVLNVMQLLQ